MDKRVVGVYDNGHDAIRAVEELKSQGYDRDDISVIAKDPENVREVTYETDTKAGEGVETGAIAGGVLGGLTGFLAGVGALAIPGIGPILAAGPIAAAIAGAATGAGAGGIAGALIGMRVPKEEAHLYERDVKAGKVLVLVDCDAKRREVNPQMDQRDATLVAFAPLVDATRNHEGLVDPYYFGNDSVADASQSTNITDIDSHEDFLDEKSHNNNI